MILMKPKIIIHDPSGSGTHKFPHIFFKTYYCKNQI